MRKSTLAISREFMPLLATMVSVPALLPVRPLSLALFTACFLLVFAGYSPARAEAVNNASTSDDESRLALRQDRNGTGKSATRLTPGSRAEAAQRAALLERLRSSGDDALPGSVEPEIAARAIEALLREVLDGLAAHEAGEGLQPRTEELEATVQRTEAPRAEVVYFGASDHLLNFSLDIYRDPLKSLTGRPDLHLDQVDPRDFDYPIVLNARVQNWMVYFLTRGRRWFVKWLARAERYGPLIIPELEKAGLPKNLLYQAMIESGFNPYATSSARAVGVWQFIQTTGREYGLEQNWWIDERRDPVLATASAIAFMSHLYRRFGRWEVASAAYNAGGGKLRRAVQMYETEDFWEMSASGRTYLAAETRNYVPKIIASAILATYAERYGLAAEIPDEHRLSPWQYDIVPVPESTDLAVVARLVGTSTEEIQAMNPALKRGYTPPGTNNYPLNLPVGKGELFAEKFAKLPAQDRVTFVRHKIRRGDTLNGISATYKVPVKTIKKMNRIRNARSLRVGKRLLLPVRSTQMPSRKLVHVVARGETLSRIAAGYGTTVAALKKGNKLSGTKLSIGQKLKVTTRGMETAAVLASTEKRSSSKSRSAKSSSSKRKSESKSRPSSYTVRRGDSLSEISKRFGVSVADLKSVNKLKGRATIYPGDKLRLTKKRKAPKTVSYTVRSGDTLSGIASSYGMKTSDVMKRNGLKNDRIKVGQELKLLASGRGGSAIVVKVEKGDSLYGIASRHKVSVDSIRSWNGLSSNTIRVGQQLKVYPGRSKSDRKKERAIAYQVQSGDTLWGISRKYGVSIKDLKSWNGMRHDKVRPGQRLRVILR